jgi:tRNA threonylcarbamoyladenosine biosynthesis protein TsaE
VQGQGRYNYPVPVLDANTVDFTSSSPAQTQRVGARIGELLRPGDLVCLHGDLGAGKTTLVQGIARGWGSAQAARSPTFVLVHEYKRADGLVLYHLDAFRLKPGERPGLELDDALDRGAVVVEWPERIAGILERERIQVELRWIDDTRRNLRFEGKGARPEEVLRDFRKLAFGN